METFSLKINIYSEQEELLESIQEPMVYSMKISDLNEIVLEALDLKISEESLKFKYLGGGIQFKNSEIFKTYESEIKIQIEQFEYFTLEAYLEFNDDEKDFESQEEGVKITSSRTQSDQVPEELPRIEESGFESTIKDNSGSKNFKNESSFDLLETSKKVEVELEDEIKYFQDDEFEKYFQLAKDQASKKMFLNSARSATRALRRINVLSQGSYTQIGGKLCFLLGFLKSFQSKLDMSQEYFQVSLENFFNLDGVGSIFTSCVTSNLSTIFYEIGDYEQSIEFQVSARSMIKRLNKPYEFELASIYYNIGIINLKLKQTEVALEFLKTAFQKYVNILGDDDLHVADTLEAIGQTLYRMNILSDAIDFSKKCYKISERILGEDHPRLSFVLDKLAIMYASNGELDQAEMYLLKSLDIRKNHFGHHPLVADTLFNFSKIMIMRGDTIKAINYFKRCCGIYYHFIEFEKNLRMERQEILSESASKLQEVLQFKYVKSSHTLILLLFNKENYKDCLEEIKNLKNIPDKELIEGPILCKVESIRARCYLMLGDYKEAYKVALKSVDLFREEYGEMDGQTADAYFKLGYICKFRDKEDEALVFLTNAINIAKSTKDVVNIGDNGNLKFVDLCKRTIEMECA